MKVLIVLSAFAAVAYASSGIITGTHLAYVNLVPGAPTGPDGRVVDTPEVAVAKAEHAAAYINEKFTLANVAARNYAVPAVVSAYAAPGHVSAYASPLAYARVVPGAPIGLDGRVVDTPEVAVAKAEHHAAHINEKVTLANQAARNYAIPSVISAYSTPLLNKYVY